jgi:hypothetical protein
MKKATTSSRTARALMPAHWATSATLSSTRKTKKKTRRTKRREERGGVSSGPGVPPAEAPVLAAATADLVMVLMMPLTKEVVVPVVVAPVFLPMTTGLSKRMLTFHSVTRGVPIPVVVQATGPGAVPASTASVQQEKKLLLTVARRTLILEVIIHLPHRQTETALASLTIEKNRVASPQRRTK